MIPFPRRLDWTREKVSEKTIPVRHTAGEERPFRYSLRVPNGWERRPPAPNGGGSRRLAMFSPPSPLEAEVSITATLLTRDVNPADFIENELLASGAEIVEKRTAYGPAGGVSDLLSRQRRSMKTYLTRTTMAKDASMLYRVDCTAAEAEYAALADLFLLALASFRLMEPTHRTVAEPTQSFRYVDPCPFLFQHPTSWSVVPEHISREAVTLRLDNLSGGRCAGRLYVALVPIARSADARAALGDFVFRIAGARIAAGDVRDSERPPIEGLDSPVETVVPVVLGEHDLECRALLARGGKVQLGIALLGPSRSSSADWWAVNKRAYEIVRDTISAVQ